MSDECDVRKSDGINLLLSKNVKGVARFNVTIRGTNIYQHYECYHNKYTAEGFNPSIFLSKN